MSSIWERYATVILVAVLVGVPLGGLVSAWLARVRVSRGWMRRSAWKSSIADVCLVMGTAPWLWMIMTPAQGPGGIQLVPLRDIQAVIAGEDALVQLVGNLLVFAAVGFIVPIRFSLGTRLGTLGKIALLAGALSLLVELLQLILPIGRVASIDDILLNTAGAVFASLVSLPWWRTRTSKSYGDEAISAPNGRSAAPISSRSAPSSARTMRTPS